MTTALQRMDEMLEEIGDELHDLPMANRTTNDPVRKNLWLTFQLLEEKAVSMSPQYDYDQQQWHEYVKGEGLIIG